MLNIKIVSCVVPELLNTAVLKPLYKTAARDSVKSYRPIFILSFISQVFEKHVFLTMRSFLDRFEVISPHQYGFISGRGTQYLLDDFADFVYSSFENNQFTYALFLDVSKAFDTINHKILCHILEKTLFHEPFLGLFFVIFNFLY